MAYREQWGRDVVIDLIGYRRYGHNETDEPAYTQPRMAAQIKEHKPVSELYAERLVAEGVVSSDEVAAEGKEQLARLQGTLHELRAKMEAGEYEDPSSTAMGTGELDRTKSPEVETAVSEKRLRTPQRGAAPGPRQLHHPPQAAQAAARRGSRSSTQGEIEYGHAEALAFASLLTEGTHIRLTGQDTERGHLLAPPPGAARREHRPALRADPEPLRGAGAVRAPQQPALGGRLPRVRVRLLGGLAGVADPLGGAVRRLRQLRAGDHRQFIAAGESKWGQTTRLTLLLPHGYEGAGPEHSSARIERFIQLGSEGNIRLANPTTAAQYFHLLRRQARIAKPRPLVVFTPEGPAAAARPPPPRSRSSPSGSFAFVLDDPRTADRREEVDRLVLCNGKVFYDIDQHDRREDATPSRSRGSSCSTRSPATSSRP